MTPLGEGWPLALLPRRGSRGVRSCTPREPSSQHGLSQTFVANCRDIFFPVPFPPSPFGFRRFTAAISKMKVRNCTTGELETVPPQGSIFDPQSGSLRCSEHATHSVNTSAYSRDKAPLREGAALTSVRKTGPIFVATGGPRDPNLMQAPLLKVTHVRHASGLVAPDGPRDPTLVR